MKTARLRFVRLARDSHDERELYGHMSSGADHIDDVSEYLLWEPHETPRDTRKYLRDAERRWEARERATYAVYPRRSEDDAGTFAGVATLDPDWDRRTAELSIWLRKRFWGRGYSGERASRFMRLAFERLDLEVVAMSHQDGNERSRRAIEKYVGRFGGQKEGVLRNFVTTDEEARDLHRYTVSREQYVEKRG